MRPDFAAIRRTCDGMMRPEVYAAVYDAARSAPEGAIVELGTGHGAATVCLALGLRDGDRPGLVVTFDKFAGGSRKAYGDAEANLRLTRTALATLGVADDVEIIPGDVAATVPARAPGLGALGLAMLDVDGRIDRDLAVLYDQLVDDAIVIVDDVADRVRVTLRPDGSARVDQKHRLTKLLLESAVMHGLLCSVSMVNQTWLGRRIPGKTFADWPAAARLECYRQLVFATSTEVR